MVLHAWNSKGHCSMLWMHSPVFYKRPLGESIVRTEM